MTSLINKVFCIIMKYTFQTKEEIKMTINKIQNGMSIVLLGNFNPLMFHPIWFSSNGVISKSEADFVITSKQGNTILSPGLTIFQTLNLEFNITQDRFMIQSLKEPSVTVIDAIQRTFQELSSIRISAIGINYFSHVQLPSMSFIHRFADRIAPKKVWSTLLEDEVSGDDRQSGLLKMIMQKKTDKLVVNLSIEPSQLVKQAIYVHCNHHYPMSSDFDSAAYALEIISENHEIAYTKTHMIIDEIFGGLDDE